MLLYSIFGTKNWECKQCLIEYRQGCALGRALQPLAFARPIETQKQRDMAKASRNEPLDLFLTAERRYLRFFGSYESYYFQNLKLAGLLVSMVHENSVVDIS